MRTTRDSIRNIIKLREDELDLAEREALYEGATRALLDNTKLEYAAESIKRVWEVCHASAEKRRRGK